MSFQQLVGGELTERLARDKIISPTEIQRMGIPDIIAGKSAALISKTGTGKTLAYLLPVIYRIDPEIKQPQAFIIAPTHELAAQVYKTASHLLEGSAVQAALIIGGADIHRQMLRLKEKPRIIIGSAGRILELIKLKKLSAHYVKTIIADEADRLFDEQNIATTTQLIKSTLKDRQLVLVSASVNEQTITSAKEFTGEIEIISASETNRLPDSISHVYFLCEERNKFDVIRKILHGETIKKVIIFSKSRSSIELLTKRLNYHGIPAVAIYGEAFKRERKQALFDFNAGRATVLVASDIAARGLDIADVTHIISHEVPENPIFYLHRAGRCGRAGAEGLSIALADRNELEFIKNIEKKFSISFIRKEMRYGTMKNV